MAVTNEKSTQAARHDLVPPKLNPSYDERGVVQSLGFEFTQGAAAGDATSTARLCKVPGGKLRILRVDISNSAFGAARTLDVGYEAHTDKDGAAVAADPNAYTPSALDVSAAADNLVRVHAVRESRDGYWINATVAGGTIPAGATLKGNVEYVMS